MIEFAVGTIGRAQSGVPKRGIDLLRAMDAVRFDAAREVATALAGLSVKRAKSAAVPGAGSTFLSRCQNGDDCNPLFQAGQHLRPWPYRRDTDRAYADAPALTINEVLERDSEIDPKDDHLRFLAAKGCPVARMELIEVKQRQLAYLPTMILTLQEQG